MAHESFLPIKVVFKQDSDNKPFKRRKIEQPEPLCDVTPQLRNSLIQQIDSVSRHFARSFATWPGLPAVAKVTLKPEAIAKYRRPTTLFNTDTCPIIGGGTPQELYASILPMGLSKLSARIRTTAAASDAHISYIESITPFTSADALGGMPLDLLSNFVAENFDRPLKFRLFKHRTPAENNALQQALIAYCGELNIGEIEVLDYAPNLSMFALHDVDTDAVNKVANFIGTQSFGTFPNYHIVRTASRAVANVTATNFPPPDPTKEYGVVGVIDTGTDITRPHIMPWIVDRHSYVPESQQNNDHGSFVAGLIIHPRLLNNGDTRFPSVSSRIVDIVALDKSGMIDEYDLRNIVEDAIRRYPHVKMWNMSLAMEGNICKDDKFSEFAVFVDNLCREHGVLFHLPAGNYCNTPFRTWPPQSGLGEDDRICPPADSVRSLVVGSRAHRESTNSRVKDGQPSPFSRRGPAPSYLMKPEISGWGGNCDSSGGCVQIGVLSLDGSGHISENLGTSFASPPVASVSANIFRELQVDGETPSPVLIKAMQIHSAFMKTGVLDSNIINYSGVGSPADIDEIIGCTNSSATCIFQIPVTTSPLFARRPFPMPKCLEHGGKGLLADIYMTLLYDSPLDHRFKAEYCRNNVKASLGTVRKKTDKITGAASEIHHREIEQVPKELDEGWEADLIKNGYKWSPLKFYHHRFVRGPTDYDWQLQLSLEHRSEFNDHEAQLVYLILTIRDPLGTQPVYNEMVQQMNKMGWDSADLKIRSRNRLEG